MLIDELKKIAKESGVVGAGGAGFPSYAKMTEQADRSYSTAWSVSRF